MSTKKSTISINAGEINSPTSEPILSHLRMKTGAALLLTDDWAIGKTYHIKKYIFPLIESNTETLSNYLIQNKLLPIIRDSKDQLNSFHKNE